MFIWLWDFAGLLLSSSVDVVLFRILERLVGVELHLGHPLQDSVVRELLLELKEGLSNLPLILRLGKLRDS